MVKRQRKFAVVVAVMTAVQLANSRGNQLIAEFTVSSHVAAFMKHINCSRLLLETNDLCFIIFLYIDLIFSMINIVSITSQTTPICFYF